MKKSKNKVLIILLVVIALLAIAGGAFAFTYFCTDIFKSGQELFVKYLTQNLDELNATVNLSKIDEIEEKLKQNKHEETISASYTYDGRASSTTKATIDIQNDPTIEKTYGMISFDIQDLDEALKIEYMKEDDVYSLRFTNIVKQFLSIQNNELKQLAEKLNLDEGLIEKIPDKIDLEKLSFDKIKITEEEKNKEINRYLELLYNNIAKEKYQKNKNTVITLNGNTITTNAYILTISMQDVKDLTIKVLETLKQDEVVLGKLQILDEIIQEYSEESLKTKFVEYIQELIDELKQEDLTEDELKENVMLTVYETNGNTVRVKAEKGLQYITLDTAETEGKKQLTAKYVNIGDDNTQSSKEVIFLRESDQELKIQINTVEGEEQQSNDINIKLAEKDKNIKIDVNIKNQEGEITLNRNINFVDEIDYKIKLDDSNNIILNKLTSDQISNIFTLVSEKINTEYIEKIMPKLITLLSLLENKNNDVFNTLPEGTFGENEEDTDSDITGEQVENR